MVEFRSALNGRWVPGRFGAAGSGPPLKFSEIPLETLFQISGWPDSFASNARQALSVLGLESIGTVGSAQTAGPYTTFRIAPERIIVRTADADALSRMAREIESDNLPLLDLSHARAVTRIQGLTAPEFLKRLVSIDLDPRAFTPASFALTEIHTVPVMLHRMADDSNIPCFELYVPYTWAASLWDLIRDTASPFGYEVVE